MGASNHDGELGSTPLTQKVLPLSHIRKFLEIENYSSLKALRETFSLFFYNYVYSDLILK